MDVPKNVNPEVQDSMLPHQILFWEIIKAKRRGEIDDRLEDDSENSNNFSKDDYYEWGIPWCISGNF